MILNHSRVFAHFFLGLNLTLALVLPAPFAHAKQTVSEYYEDAQKRFNEADYDASIVQLKNVLQEDPKNLPALVLLGQSYIENGDGPAAESTFNEATAAGADPTLTAAPRARALLLQFRHRELLAESIPASLPHTKRAELLEVKAEAAMQLNDRKALKKILKDINDLHVNSPGELAIRVTIAMREGKLDVAKRLVDTAIAAAPNSPLTWLSRASLSHVEDDLPGALRQYGEVIALEPANTAARLARIGLLFDLRRFDDTDEDFAFFEKRESKDPRFLFLKAIKTQQEGEPKKAKAILDETSKLIEILGSRIVSGNLQLLMIAGVSNFHLGNYELAENYLERYVKSANGETQTRRMLATLKIGKKEYASAIKILVAALEEQGDTAELLTLLAKAYSADGQHQRATAALERATVLKPNDAQLQTSLAVSRAMKGQSEAALAALSKVFENDDARQTAGMPLAIMRLNRGDYAGGESVAAQLVEDEPENLTYLNLHGVALVGLSRLEEARARFEKALSLNEKYHPAALNLAKLDRRTQRFDAAQTRLQALLKLAPKDVQVMLELARNNEAQGKRKNALKWARSAYKASPDSFEIAQELIALLIAEKDLEGARNIVFEQENKYPNNLYVLQAKSALLIAAQKPEDLRPHLKHMAEVAEFNLDWLLPIGEQQLQFGFLSDAQYTLFKALQERPQDVALRARVTDVELALGNLDAAEDRARRLVADSPAHPAGYALRGDIANARKQFAVSAEFYSEARKLTGGNRPEIALKQHLTLAQSGEHAAAEQVLTEWLTLNPEDVWAAQLLAEQAMNQGHLELAKTRFEKLLATVPAHAGALNNLANVLIQQNNLSDAVEKSQSALAIEPGNPLFNDTLGWALVKLDRVAEGLPYLREARTRAATVPEIRYHLAVALHRLGRRDEALKELNTALSEKSDFTDRSDALRLKGELGG